jgi:hypothetical protein
VNSKSAKKREEARGEAMRTLPTLLGLTVIAVSTAALAEDETPAAAPATEPPGSPVGDGAAVPVSSSTAAPASELVGGATYVSRRLTVGAGALQVTLPLVLNLSKDEVLKPVWIPLDLRYGVTDQLEVFLSHNYFGTPLAFRGGGVCIGGKDRNCPKVYDNLNLGAALSFWRNAGIEVAGIGALEFRALDAVHLAVDLGVGFKYGGERLALRAAPQLGLAVNKRDEQPKTFIAVPVQVAAQATPGLAVFVDTGLFGPTSDFKQAYAVPLGVGAAFAVMPTLDLGAEAMLPLVLTGNTGNKPLDTRTLMVYATLRTR